MQITGGPLLDIGIFISICIVMIFVLGVIFVLNQRRFSFDKKLKKIEIEFQQNMLLSQLEIQEQTFNYISQEIHDHIGQRLTLARFYLNSRKERSIQESEELLDVSANLIGEAISDLKFLSRSLTSDFIKEEGLIRATSLEAERISKLTNLQVTVKAEGNTQFLPTDTELIIFRIVQEALQNIIKHAHASEVGILLKYETSSLHLSVTDNGQGFNIQHTNIQTNGKQSGLANIKKRAELLNVSFHIHSSPGQGVCINIQLPIHNTNIHEAKKS